MKRRSFLSALTAASLGVVLKNSFTEFGRAQNTAQAGAGLAGTLPRWVNFLRTQP
jgi:hypothetical protein